MLIDGGNVSDATRRLGINRMTAYGWRSDPAFADRWDVALDIARQGLREQVVETACAMGVGRWVPLLDPTTDEVVLDDEFEPVMRFETGHVDARVLMKMMDKVMRSEDGASMTAVQVNNHIHTELPAAPKLVTPTVDAEFEEIFDVDA
jgi:hypothetical protein